VNIDVRYGLIEDVFSSGVENFVVLEGEKINASVIFSSLPSHTINSNSEYFLWQHFKGWVIETEKETFNPEEATLMDFRINQHNDTRFVYVMPFSKEQALVEYTVFSETRLQEEEYNEHLKNYCESVLGIRQNEYTVVEEEFGMIPMTNRAFPSSHHNIIFIGSAGGQTKASSGYTFRFIQKHSRHIVDELIKGDAPHYANTSKKFNFYDSVLLRILSERKLSGARIFTTLFENNDIREVFKFLDNETSVAEDIRLISTLPKTKFLSAAISHLLQ
jgi:lycopene beta-cyclase